MEIHTTVTVLMLCTSVLAQDGTVNLGGSIMVQDPSADQSVNPSPDAGGGGSSGIVLPGGTGDTKTSQTGTDKTVQSGGSGSSGDKLVGTNTMTSGRDQSTNTVDSTGTNTEKAASSGINQGDMGQGSSQIGGGDVSSQGEGNQNIGGGADTLGSDVNRDRASQGNFGSSSGTGTRGMTETEGSSFRGGESNVFGVNEGGPNARTIGSRPMIAGVTSTGGGKSDTPSSDTNLSPNIGTPDFGGRSANTGDSFGRSSRMNLERSGSNVNVNDRRRGIDSSQGGAGGRRENIGGGGMRMGGGANIGAGGARMEGTANIGGGGSGIGRGTGRRGGIGNEGIGGGRGVGGGRGEGGGRGMGGGPMRSGGGTGMRNDRISAAAAAAAAENVIRGAPRRDAERRATRDRIIGGVGGGGFDGPSIDRGACFRMCEMDTDTCYRPHNCTHYKHCYPFSGTICTCTLRPCSFGTLWSMSSGRCETASNVYCDDDPCDKNVGLTAYTSNINCKSYYICSEEYRRRSLPMCCNDFHSYSDSEKRCVPDETCGRIPCTLQSSFYDPDLYATSTTEPVKDFCPLEASRHDPTKYNHKVYRLARPRECAPTTVFDNDACACINTGVKGGPPVVRGCKETRSLDFKKGSLDEPNVPVPVYANDVRYVGTALSGEYGVFNGRSSQIEVPYFSAKPLKQFVVRIRFYTLGNSGPQRQVLMSFCRSFESLPPGKNIPVDGETNTALAILLDIKDRKLIFEGYSLENKIQNVLLDLDFQPEKWNSVELIFDGRMLIARNRVLTSAKPIPQEKTIPLRGFINGGDAPLRFGSCHNNDGFHGHIDLIKIYECIPQNPRGRP